MSDVSAMESPDRSPSAWVRFWCGVMGWHPQGQREWLGTERTRCRRCGYVGMVDSQGCLF